MKIIQYDETIEEYNQALLNTLRGFTPKYDFISSWVPDGDIQRSVISLVEAAFADNVFEFTLVFKVSTLNSIHFDDFIDALKTIAQFNVEKVDSEYHIVFTAMKQKDHKKSFASNQVLQVKNNNCDALQEQIAQLNNDSIYQQKVEALLLNVAYQKSLRAEPGLHLVSVASHGVQLEALLDDKGLVHQLAYNGEVTTMQQGILEGACQWLLDLPLEDIRDNGVALVEYKLREFGKVRRMAGIQVHFNFSPVFEQLASLLKLLCKNYGSRKVNTFDIRNNLQLSEEQAVRLRENLQSEINLNIKKLLPNVDVSITEIDSSARVTVMVEGDALATEKSQLLMDLEVLLRQKVHPAIQIYSTLYTDRNTKRQGHEWAIKL